MRRLMLCVLLTCCGIGTSDAGLMLPLFGNDAPEDPFATYGGEIEYGTVTWSANPGQASFLVELDPSFKIFGFSFNTTVPANDFLITATGAGWSYRGLSTPHGIGTDEFDFTLYRALPGISNTLEFTVTGSHISQDTDFLRPHPHEFALGSHFGVVATDPLGAKYKFGDSFERVPAIPEPTSLTVFGIVVMAIGTPAIRRRRNSLCV